MSPETNRLLDALFNPQNEQLLRVRNSFLGRFYAQLPNAIDNENLALLDFLLRLMGGTSEMFLIEKAIRSLSTEKLRILQLLLYR